ncbi:hypothetical protein MHK_004772 [Candidatus Magnetomorum sp. HK-1]|nr:hypothetical protein MHK_004772 [Candidatus Magnetomorum sp. HK-1]
MIKKYTMKIPNLKYSGIIGVSYILLKYQWKKENGDENDFESNFLINYKSFRFEHLNYGTIAPEVWGWCKKEGDVSHGIEIMINIDSCTFNKIPRLGNLINVSNKKRNDLLLACAKIEAEKINTFLKITYDICGMNKRFKTFNKYAEHHLKIAQNSPDNHLLSLARNEIEKIVGKKNVNLFWKKYTFEVEKFFAYKLAFTFFSDKDFVRRNNNNDILVEKICRRRLPFHKRKNDFIEIVETALKYKVNDKNWPTYKIINDSNNNIVSKEDKKTINELKNLFLPFYCKVDFGPNFFVIDKSIIEGHDVLQ